MAAARPGFEIAKAGWMHRLSSVLRRWKKNWFVLYQNGDLKYFESPNSHEAEECIVVRAECFQVLQGKAVDSSVHPPDGAKREQLLQLKLRSGELTLCAESPDEMRMWQLLLDDARMMRGPPPSHVTMQAPPPYPGQPVVAPPQTVIYPPQVPRYAGQTVYTTTTTNMAYPRQQVAYAYPGQVYSTHPYGQPPVGQTTVIYTDSPRRYRRGYDADMATGFVAGAALGTMMWSPMLFW